MHNKALKGSLYIFVGAVFWSLSSVLVKSVATNPVVLAVGRTLLGGILLLPFLNLKKIRFNRYLLFLIFGMAGICFFFMTANRYTTAANASALHFTAPLWVFAFSCYKNKGINVKELPAILFLVAGIAFILTEPDNGGNVLGNFIALGSGISFGVVTVLWGTIPNEEKMNHLCFCNLAAGLLLMLIIPKDFSFLTLNLREIFVIVALALSQQIIPYILFGKGLTLIPTSRASMISVFEFILNPIWVYLLIKELPTIHGALGWICILIGFFINLLMINQKGRYWHFKRHLV